MGLDTIELVMEVEDAFDVQIPDERACEMYTVGDVYDFIIESKRNSLNPRDTCLSAATFYMIRRELLVKIGVARESVRPRTMLESVLPVHGRRTLWLSLQDSLGLKFPRLCRPNWLATMAGAFAVVFAVSVSMFTYLRWGPIVASLTWILSLISFGIMAWMITLPFAIYPRASFNTFRGLSNVLLAHNYARLSDRFDDWNPADVWEALRIIIVEQLAVKPEVVTKDALIIDDLGAE